MQTTQGQFGPYRYEHVYKPGLGHRVNWHDQPSEGDVVRRMGRDHTVLYVESMGKLVTADAEGRQSASFPSDLEYIGGHNTGVSRRA